MANSMRKVLSGLLLFALSTLFVEGKAEAGECLICKLRIPNKTYFFALLFPP